MKADDLLGQITIPTPCPMDWNLMRGDDRVRFCESCGKHVYNFAALTSEEAVSLIRAQGGELCGQLYRRPDGTLVTADCPAEPRPAPRGWQFSIRAIMAVIAGFAALFGITRLFAESQSQPPPVPLGGVICVPDMTQAADGQSSDQPE